MVACTRTEAPVVRPNVRFFDRLIFKLCDPGPMIKLRAALPNVPDAGIENAAVLKYRSVVGSAR